MNITDFKDKKVWAVVGSVHNKEKFANKIYKFLKNKGYTVYAVDPSGNEVDGDPSYRTLAEVPELIEAIDMVINPVRGDAYIEEANMLGIKHIWFQPGAESEEILKKADTLGFKSVHDKCVMVEF